MPEYFVLSSGMKIDFSKLTHDLLLIINQQRMENNREEVDFCRDTGDYYNHKRSILGNGRCKTLATRIRPENITYNSDTDFYSVSFCEYATPNPMLCPWNPENCLYALFMSVFYLSTKFYLHRENESVWASKKKLRDIFSNRAALSALNIPEEARRCLRKISQFAKEDREWELLPQDAVL